MRLLLTFLLLFTAACSQTAKKPHVLGRNETLTDLTVFDGCSALDISLKDIWILLCKKIPHAQRFEIYEYSQFFKTFKRLTFQDGLIQDVTVAGFENIFYTSTYDESKEQFLAVSRGSAVGTDLYLRKRNLSDFERVTSDPGIDHSLFWSENLQNLFFVHSNEKGHTLRRLDPSLKVSNVISIQAEEITSPVLSSSQDLYWIQSNEKNRNYTLMKSRLGRRPKPVLRTSAKMIRMSLASAINQVHLAFSMAEGNELWSLDLDSLCFKKIFKGQTGWNRFQMVDSDTLYLSVEKEGHFSIQKVRPDKASDQLCQNSPPSLGVELL